MASSSAPTIKEVARLSGVSVGTVSKALNGTGSISDGVRLKIVEAARTLGYAPHPSARSLRSGATKMLGLLVADLANPFFLLLVEEIEQRASDLGYSMLLYNSNEEPLREKRNLSALTAQRVDGVFVIPTRESWTGRAVAFAGLSCPLVQVDRALDGVDAPFVTIDNYLAGRLAANHLVDLAHRKIAILSGTTEHQIARHRVEGFRSTLAERNVPFDDAQLIQKLFTVEDARQAIIPVLQQPDPPTAIFSTNNHITLGLLQGLLELGLGMPDDVSVVVVDELPWAGLLSGGLTTVVQPSAAIADAAMATVLGAIGAKTGDATSDGTSTVLKPSLVIRKSTTLV